MEERRVVVQGHVRLAAAQAVVPEKVKQDRGEGSRGRRLPPAAAAAAAGGGELLASPQEEGHVALLALPALHGAVQGGAGVSEGEVVELAVRVGAAALISLKTGGGTDQHRGRSRRNRTTDSPRPWT